MTLKDVTVEQSTTRVQITIAFHHAKQKQEPQYQNLILSRLRDLQTIYIQSTVQQERYEISRVQHTRPCHKKVIKVRWKEKKKKSNREPCIGFQGEYPLKLS